MRKVTILAIITLIFQHAFAQESNGSSIAFTLTENDLLPESVAYDPNSQSFYIGSTRKGSITKVSSNGEQSTFVESGQHGQWMVIGIKIDAQRNELWFCSSGGENLVGYTFSDDAEGRPAGVFKVDLKTGKLINKYTLEQSGEVHFFNDLVIADNGDVYVTHMFNDHVIYKIDRETDQLEAFAQTDFIKYPNGMDLSDDGQFLFVAHSDGIARVTLNDATIVSLDIANDVEAKRRGSIDGLYFYRNSLIGVQAGLSRVTRYDLSQPMDAIMRQKVLDEKHPNMDHPTTGVVIGDEFYYVANAQFEKVNEDGSLSERPDNPIILKIQLK